MTGITSPASKSAGFKIYIGGAFLCASCVITAAYQQRCKEQLYCDTIRLNPSSTKICTVLQLPWFE